MEKILSYTFNLLDYTPNDEEVQQYNNFLFKHNDLFLITEKNVVKNTQEDNYNFGNYYNLKEKDSHVINVFYTNEFLESYASENEKKYLNYLKENKISLDYINKFMIIYNNIKYNKFKKSFVVQNDINNYIFN